MPDTLRFHLADPGEQYAAVRVASDLGRWELQRNGGGWLLERRAPPLLRLEYLLEVERTGGATETICDPSNPQRAPGAFGDKSVITLPGYEKPWWLASPAPAGERLRMEVPSRALKAPVTVEVWSPEGATGEPLPLLVANDGPEYDRLSALTAYAAATVATQELPPFRVALLAPGDRDEWYSASAAYARALIGELLPEVRAHVPVAGLPVGMGASLGGLAMLHAHRRTRAAFAGLFLQSGSFFMPRFDSHESGFPRWQRIVRFVRGTLRTQRAEDPLPIGMTCGACEENRFNNRVAAEALAAQGHQVRYGEVPDGHNHVAWRDAFEPHLTDLLVRAWWS